MAIHKYIDLHDGPIMVYRSVASCIHLFVKTYNNSTLITKLYS